MDRTLVTTHLVPGKYIKKCIDNWLKSYILLTILTNIVEAILPIFLSLVSEWGEKIQSQSSIFLDFTEFIWIL